MTWPLFLTIRFHRWENETGQTNHLWFRYCLNNMAAFNYKETELWHNSKAFLIETYRLTQDWSENGKDLADSIRSLAQHVVRSVPNAFKKPGISGNYHLDLSISHLSELDALCDVAEALGFVEVGTFDPLLAMAEPIRAEFKALDKAAKLRAQELMKSRTTMFDIDDEE